MNTQNLHLSLIHILYEEGKRRYLTFSGTQFMVDSVPTFDSITGLSPTVAAVSYTHLDVYKRQLLRGINRDQIERGQVLAKPGTVTCHKKFTAQVYVLTKDEGGRHTPFFNNYRPCLLYTSKKE